MAALIDGPYPEFGGVGLREVLAFSPEDNKRAEEDAATFLDKWQPKSEDVRILLAGARLAYARDALKYRENGVHKRIINRIPKKTGVRVEEKRHQPKELEALEAHDRKTGAGLVMKLDELCDRGQECRSDVSRIPRSARP